MTVPDVRNLAISEYRSNRQAWSASWDPRRKTLYFKCDDRAYFPHPIRIRLDSFEQYREDVGSLTKDAQSELDAIFENWPVRASDIDNAQSLRPFELLVFFRLQSAMARDDAESASVDPLIRWVLLQGSSVAWLQRFDPSLSFRSRYLLMKAALRELSAAREDEEAHLASVDYSDRETRETYWLTLRLHCDLAEEWCRESGNANPEAQSALRKTCLSYLQVLKDEPYRIELDNFLDQMRSGTRGRTGSESEISRLLAIERNLQAPAQEASGGRRWNDTAVDLKFFSWFLERYDLSSARILMWRSLPQQERSWARACIGLVLLSALLFAIQVFDLHGVEVLGVKLVQFSSFQVWILQCAAQAAALFITAWLSPAFFNIVLPRALFGSLVTWITLIFTSLPGLWAIEIDEKRHSLRNLSHHFLQDHPGLSILLMLPCVGLALVFVMREIGHWTSSRKIVMRRACLTTFGLYLGALFWGILFALPIRRVLELPPEVHCRNCLLPIAVIGASLAALFGIVVELIWEDKSIAEPLEEPI
jgi:hypothetical protein